VKRGSWRECLTGQGGCLRPFSLCQRAINGLLVYPRLPFSCLSGNWVFFHQRALMQGQVRARHQRAQHPAPQDPGRQGGGGQADGRRTGGGVRHGGRVGRGQGRRATAGIGWSAVAASDVFFAAATIFAFPLCARAWWA